jgi:lipopolysaccharide biosynthesis glycosyltransferase
VNAISLLCSFNACFRNPALVSLHSALSHLPTDWRIHLEIVSDSDPQEFCRALLAALDGRHANLSIHYTEFDETRFYGARDPRHLSWLTYGRLLLSKIDFPTERVLYLDADTFTRHSLRELCSVDLEDLPVAAAHELHGKHLPEELAAFCSPLAGPDMRFPYFNAGVLVIDVARWRHENIDKRTLSFLTAHPEVCMAADQCALNVVLAGRWKMVDGGWNYLESQFRRAGHRHGSRTARIVHFAGIRKPWRPRYSQSQIAREYFAYAAAAGIHGWRPSRKEWIKEILDARMSIYGYHLQQIRKRVVNGNF